MTAAITVGLDAVNFRANPLYELVLFDRLPSESKAHLAGLEKDPDLYGVLRPREGAGLAVKSVCRETALLYLTLQQPGPLPAYVKANTADGWRQAVAALVLDGLLEVEMESGFRSGADAYDFLCGEVPTSTASGRLARLSVDAMKYAQALPLQDPARLSARLYFYHRLPASPVWRRKLPDTEAVRRHLGLGDGSLRRMLEARWAPVEAPASLDGWMIWRPREAPATAPGRSRHKLYLSPDTRCVAEAFRAAARVLSELPVLHLKVGRDVYGLLRPDKIVIYFGSRADLQRAADQLHPALDGLPAHGVPFTAEISGNGLLSWGIDPPAAQHLLAWQERESWRLWLTNRLATALLSGKAARSAELEPWQFALQRLRIQGIDVATWMPVRPLWPEAVKPGA
ncbi:hypothetical protein ACIGPN_34795 [Streptomyces afghaniensis]|uniref:hypothetical protein n=1 Tax=Streptomyces afghaniensis TaxID=66865 RepID=UPI0037D06DD1